MRCFETQNLSLQYVNDELSGFTLEQFLNHIDNCPNCKEELEMCYTIFNGMRELDNESIKISNYNIAFENRLEQSRKHLIKVNKSGIKRRVVVIMLMIAPMFCMTSDYSPNKDKGGIVYTNVTESDFYFDVPDLGTTYDIDRYIETLR